MEKKFQLYEACWNGCSEDVVSILTKNPHLLNENLGGEFDDPALIIAARCGYDQLCSQLLRIPGIQVNIEDRFGQTPLMIATAYGHYGVVNSLTNHELLEINKENDRETALHYASFNGRSATVQLLVNHDRIELNKKNKEGLTAFDNCCRGDGCDESQRSFIQKSTRESATRPRPPSTTSPGRVSASAAETSKPSPASPFPFTPSSPLSPTPPPPPAAVPAISSPSRYIYDVFLTHDWGLDERNRSNHSRVSRINSELKKRGLITWFDEERMKGNIRQLMAKAIAASRVVLVHVTERYRDKIEKGDSHDSCYYEFNYALTAHPGEVEVAVMEERMQSPEKWETRLRAEIGTLLYVAMWEDDPKIFERQCDILATRIKEKIAAGNNLSSPRPPPPLSMPVKAPSTSSPLSASIVSTVSYVEAWSLIDPSVIEGSSSDPKALTALIEELGVSESGDLEMLLVNEMIQIGDLLKTIPQRKFQSALNLPTLPSFLASKSSDGMAFFDAWDVIKPDNIMKRAINSTGNELAALLDSYGPINGGDLHWLSDDELLLIADYLKSVPKRRFKTALLLAGKSGKSLSPVEEGVAGRVWTLFSGPNLQQNCDDPLLVTSLFQEHGVETGGDLLILSKEEKLNISRMLKTIPKRKFSSLLKLNNDDVMRDGNASDAWEFINPRQMVENKHKNTSDPSAADLLAFLTTHCVKESQDLLWLNDSEISHIADYLRVVPQRKFLAAMNMTLIRT